MVSFETGSTTRKMINARAGSSWDEVSSDGHRPDLVGRQAATILGDYPAQTCALVGALS